jgi:hypothetical protein
MKWFIANARREFKPCGHGGTALAYRKDAEIQIAGSFPN